MSHAPRGLTDAGRAAVQALFFQHIERGWHPGAQLAVYRDGAPVLDLAGGDAAPGRPLDGGARMLLFSATKPIMAICIHMLHERGLLGYDHEVGRYWPDFGRDGKERATVRHVLLHQAGCPQLPADFDWSRVADWEYATGETAALPAAWAPGAATGYHALTFGWILGEVLRRIDGRTPRDFMREEIFRPLGIEGEISLGLDEAELPERMPVHAMSEVTRHDPTGAEGATSRITAAFNDDDVARAQIPAANGYGTAPAVARFYAALEQGGSLDGERLLHPETVTYVTRIHGETRHDRSLQVPKRYGLGCYVSGLDGDPFDYHDGDGAYGHSGQQSSVGYVDTGFGLAIAYVTNGLHDPAITVRRMAEMAAALRRACA